MFISFATIKVAVGESTASCIDMDICFVLCFVGD